VITRPDLDQLRARTAAAPATPARPAFGTRFRGRAAVTLLACGASLATLATYAWRHRIQPSGVDAPPFRLPEAAWRSVLSVAARTGASCPPSVPAVILYVSGSCSHCQAELARWSNRVLGEDPRLECLRLAVVAASGDDASPPPWLPASLASTLLRDHGGTVARALGVRLVPLAAYVTAEGVVISRVAGEASDAQTGRSLVELRRTSEASRGVPEND
jgi:hypothetical protein